MNITIECTAHHPGRYSCNDEHTYCAKRHANVCTFTRMGAGIYTLMGVTGYPRAFSHIMQRQRDGTYELRHGIADRLPTSVGNVVTIED